MKRGEDGEIHDDGYFHDFQDLDDFDVPGTHLTPIDNRDKGAWDRIYANLVAKGLVKPMPEVDNHPKEVLLCAAETRSLIAMVYGCPVDMVDEIVDIQLSKL